MRAPFQILAIPYRRTPDLQFCVLRRADAGQWQFVAGGGEDNETPMEAAAREISEETGIKADRITKLVSTAYVPADVISERHRKHWAKDTYVLPEYHFAFECDPNISLSDEHLVCEWLGYSQNTAHEMGWRALPALKIDCRFSSVLTIPRCHAAPDMGFQ